MQPLSPGQRYAILRQAMSPYLDGGFTVMWKSYNAACLVRSLRSHVEPFSLESDAMPLAEEMLCVAVDRFGNVATE